MTYGMAASSSAVGGAGVGGTVGHCDEPRHRSALGNRDQAPWPCGSPGEDALLCGPRRHDG